MTHNVTDEMVEKACAAAIDYVVEHEPDAAIASSWEEVPEPEANFLRGVQRRALQAALDHQ